MQVRTFKILYCEIMRYHKYDTNCMITEVRISNYIKKWLSTAIYHFYQITHGYHRKCNSINIRMIFMSTVKSNFVPTFSWNNKFSFTFLVLRKLYLSVYVFPTKNFNRTTARLSQSISCCLRWVHIRIIFHKRFGWRCLFYKLDEISVHYGFGQSFHFLIQ